jgi:hypothetical protein
MGPTWQEKAKESVSEASTAVQETAQQASEATQETLTGTMGTSADFTRDIIMLNCDSIDLMNIV